MLQNGELRESAAENFLYILEALKFLVRIQCLLVQWFIVRYLLQLKRENKFSFESQARIIIPTTPSTGAGIQPSPLLVYSRVQQWPAQVPVSFLSLESTSVLSGMRPCLPQWLFVAEFCDVEVVWEGNSMFSYPKGQGIYLPTPGALSVLGSKHVFWSLLEKAVIGRCCMPSTLEGPWSGFGVFRISMDLQANPQAERDHVLSGLRSRIWWTWGALIWKLVGICVVKNLQDWLAGILQNTYLNLGI